MKQLTSQTKSWLIKTSLGSVIVFAIGAGQSAAIADEGVIASPPLQAAERQSQSQAVQQYWTKEAMESAIPMSIREMPSPAAEGVIVTDVPSQQARKSVAKLLILSSFSS